MEDAKKSYEEFKKNLKDGKFLDDMASKLFEKIDKDKSGSVNLDEITDFMQKASEKMGAKHPVDKDKIKELFEKLDKDDSKSLNKEETKELIKAIFKEYKRRTKEVMKKHGWKKPEKK